MAPKKLTEYERKRLENIRRNEEMMAAFKVCSKASQLLAAAKRQKPRDERSSPKKKTPKPDSTDRIRRSLRNQGMPPDLTDCEAVNPNQFYRNTGPVRFFEAYRGNQSDRPLINAIWSLQKPLGELVPPISRQDRVLNASEVGYSGIEVANKETEYCLDFKSMKLKPENVDRVMPGRLMAVKFLPCNDVRMITAGNETGDVAFWKFDRSVEDENDIYLYRPHTAPISGILFHQSCLSKVFSSSYDGSIRMMNAAKEVFDLIYSSDDAIFCLSQRPTDINGLYFGYGRGGLRVVDDREGKVSCQWMLHDDRINSIEFNSQNPNVMATGSTDGTACLWDVRYVKADEPNCLKIVKHNRAVYSASFSPSGSFLATSCSDETVGIFNCADFEDNSLIHHESHTGKGQYSFRCIWGWDDRYIYMGGSMRKSIDIVSRSERRTISTLQSQYILATPCRFDIHPYNVGMLAGATLSGQVYIWTPSSN